MTQLSTEWNEDDDRAAAEAHQQELERAQMEHEANVQTQRLLLQGVEDFISFMESKRCL